jgi:hypothetical protein
VIWYEKADFGFRKAYNLSIMKSLKLRSKFYSMSRHSPLMFRLIRPQRLDMDGNPQRVLPNTQILTDSFPRCGNTFLYHLLRETQSPDLRIAHHMHSAGHLAMGSRLGIPTVTIVRQPRAACISYAIRNSSITTQDILLEYLRFHTTLTKLSAVYIIAFEQLIEKPDQTLMGISHRFPIIRHKTIDKAVLDNVAKRVDLADKRDRERRGDHRSAEFTAGKPNINREKLKAQFGSEIDTHEILLERCAELYQSIIGKLDT